VDYYSTSSSDGASGRTTAIRVAVTPAARRQVEELVNDAEPMIQRCVWRFIWTKHRAKAVVGESVEFTLDASEILELFADLRRIDVEEMERNQIEDQSRQG